MTVLSYDDYFVNAAKQSVRMFFKVDEHLVFSIKPESIHYVSLGFDTDQQMDEVVNRLVKVFKIDPKNFTVSKYSRVDHVFATAYVDSSISE